VRPSGILNPGLIELLAGAGHGDVIVLADAGLKIPRHALRIDLALVPGVPSMLEVLDAVLPEVVTESAIVADEMSSWNPDLEREVADRLSSYDIRRLPHAVFAAELERTGLGYVSTGECTAYASIGWSQGCRTTQKQWPASTKRASVRGRGRGDGFEPVPCHRCRCRFRRTCGNDREQRGLTLR
jgi:D-ribose pyranase